jgi:hypothetical protein
MISSDFTLLSHNTGHSFVKLQPNLVFIPPAKIKPYILLITHKLINATMEQLNKDLSQFSTIDFDTPGIDIKAYKLKLKKLIQKHDSIIQIASDNSIFTAVIITFIIKFILFSWGMIFRHNITKIATDLVQCAQCKKSIFTPADIEAGHATSPHVSVIPATAVQAPAVVTLRTHTGIPLTSHPNLTQTTSRPNRQLAITEF